MSSLKNTAILIVEDEALFRRRLSGFLEKSGAEVAAAESLEQARNLLDEMPFDFVLLDLNLPDGSGMDLLRKGAFSANTAVIVMTADGAIANAVEAMRLGAADYLAKPFNLDELPLIIQRARKSKQSSRLETYRRDQHTRAHDHFFFGSSLEELRRLLEKIIAADERLSANLPPVLIEGETGTGKTSIARWLHYHGPRSSGPLVEINCSTLSETLAESELFGHERGAFTDARQERIGLFEAAREGTLFLDEIPSLSPALQAKVLTAIEDKTVRRLGGNKSIEVDVRLIAATNSDLRLMVKEGEFREDLYHRLDLYRLAIPPLRERKEDLPRLAENLLEKIAQRYGSKPPRLGAEAKKQLRNYSWPGNVRELSHILERAFVFEESDELTLRQIVADPAQSGETAADPGEWLNPAFVFPDEGFSLEEAINRLIRRALDQTDGNVSAAARLLGVSRDYIRYRLEEKKRSN